MIKDYIRKADIILAIVLLIAGFGSLALLRTNTSENLKAVVYHEGEIIDEIDLSQKGEFSRSYQFDEDCNVLYFKDGSLWMEDANCNGKDCMQFGKISSSGQLIVCAPHKLLIQITGGEDVDTAAY